MLCNNRVGIVCIYVKSIFVCVCKFAGKLIIEVSSQVKIICIIISKKTLNHKIPVFQQFNLYKVNKISWYHEWIFSDKGFF